MANSVLIDALYRILTDPGVGGGHKLGNVPGATYEQPTLDTSETRRGTVAGTGTPHQTPGRSTENMEINRPAPPPGLTARQRTLLRNFRNAKGYKRPKKGRMPKGGRMY